jgi:UDP-N-acetylmuramoyl-tripeptide--D-alanyl-D-alanine ligase
VKASLQYIAAATGGQRAGADVECSGVATDSRTLAGGELFFALRGERFDGHDFVAVAAGRGAAAAVVDHPCDVPLPQVVVADTTAALGALAGAWRGRFELPVIGVAGSNGKTTTKELLAAVLAGSGPVLATRGNLNNQIGVPLTLLGLEPGHRHAVIEIGANHPGEVAALARIVRPTIALVTNAGAEHLEGFGSLEGAARAEGELFEALDSAGSAVINADDPFHGLWRGLARGARILSFGIEAPAELRATSIAGRIEAGAFLTSFDLVHEGATEPVCLRLAGRHNVMNAGAAAGAARVAGLSLPAIAAGLGRAVPVAGRLQLKPGRCGAWLIDDSYNANPSSVRAGIDVLCELPGEHWLVLGEMAELGAHSLAAHAEVGEYARQRGVTRLIACGAPARAAVAAFGPRATWFADVPGLAEAVAAELAPCMTVLVKGSRINRLERVVERLREPPAAAASGG